MVTTGATRLNNAWDLYWATLAPFLLGCASWVEGSWALLDHQADGGRVLDQGAEGLH